MLKRFALALVTIAAIAALIVTCASLRGKEEHSFGEDCMHCHGDRLQGINNVKAHCGQCHDLAPLAPEGVRDQARKETLLSEPHVHTTKNLFKSTPSCFNCHRRTDF